MDIITTLFGEGKDLNTLQMACRAFVLFFITLLFIRIAGMRSFGKKSAFDEIVVIMLGAVLSRAVTGASAFVPTVVAALVLALVHKGVAHISTLNKTIGKLSRGSKIILYKNGNLLHDNLKKCSLAQEDILEELRLSLHQNDLHDVSEIFMETNGKISIIKSS
jgi:uncharacterized membrane protein YcaP (DUF421 family)